MVLPWVTVYFRVQETLGSQETQTDSFQLDHMALGHGFLTWAGEKRKERRGGVGAEGGNICILLN